MRAVVVVAVVATGMRRTRPSPRCRRLLCRHTTAVVVTSVALAEVTVAAGAAGEAPWW